jgi:hypothetical protein
MTTTTVNRFSSTTSTFSLIAVLLISLVTSAFQLAHAGSVNGRNVNRVQVDQGAFRQVGSRAWIEQNQHGQQVFSFQETHRDDWSVYLYDASRNVRLQLDLHRKIVGYSDGNNPTTRDLYRITSGSSKMNGWLVRKVKFNKGAFVYKGNQRWVETGKRNQVRFNFNEVARDDWSVYLVDYSRDVHIQLDLHTRKIMYHTGNKPRTPLYRIARAH